MCDGNFPTHERERKARGEKREREGREIACLSSRWIFLLLREICSRGEGEALLLPLTHARAHGERRKETEDIVRGRKISPSSCMHRLSNYEVDKKIFCQNSECSGIIGLDIQKIKAPRIDDPTFTMYKKIYLKVSLGGVLEAIQVSISITGMRMQKRKWTKGGDGPTEGKVEQGVNFRHERESEKRKEKKEEDSSPLTYANACGEEKEEKGERGKFERERERKIS